MRLGAPIMDEFNNPDEWIRRLKQDGYSAAYCPVSADDSDDTIKQYAQAAESANIVIAEVGVWKNPLSPNVVECKQAIEACINQLELAEKIGACCCVNVSGSRSHEFWYGPDAKNLTEQTFEMIVESVRHIIDSVKPQRTFYTLEPMPWIYPDSAESYVRLLKAIDRKAFAVHYDPVNLINTPDKFYHNGSLMTDFFKRLGAFIKSIHAKDLTLTSDLTVYLKEIRPGLGFLAYPTLLREVSYLKDVPFMLEHLETKHEYDLSATYIRETAAQQRIKIMHP
ncbi:TIM barrel protein [candidate division KSB1 bacterium]|nr:TIM barrel protein [candidate division KSB1 bacterium]